MAFIMHCVVTETFFSMLLLHILSKNEKIGSNERGKKDIVPK